MNFRDPEASTAPQRGVGRCRDRLMRLTTGHVSSHGRGAASDLDLRLERIERRSAARPGRRTPGDAGWPPTHAERLPEPVTAFAVSSGGSASCRRGRESKDWVVLGGPAVASGGQAFGTVRVDLAKSSTGSSRDTRRRRQSRLATVLESPTVDHVEPGPAPTATSRRNGPRLDIGGKLDELDTWLGDRRRSGWSSMTRASIRAGSERDDHGYANDYDDVAVLRGWPTPPSRDGAPSTSRSMTGNASGRSEQIDIALSRPVGSMAAARPDLSPRGKEAEMVLASVAPERLRPHRAELGGQLSATTAEIRRQYRLMSRANASWASRVLAPLKWTGLGLSATGDRGLSNAMYALRATSNGFDGGRRIWRWLAHWARLLARTAEQALDHQCAQREYQLPRIRPMASTSAEPEPTPIVTVGR